MRIEWGLMYLHGLLTMIQILKDNFSSVETEGNADLHSSGSESKLLMRHAHSLVEVEGWIQAQVEVEREKRLDYWLTCIKMLRMGLEEVERNIVDMESHRKHSASADNCRNIVDWVSFTCTYTERYDS